MCLTDPTILERTLGPIFDNAVKYAGGATVRARREGERIVIDIDDDGPGIETDLRDRVFERFVRGQHTIAGMGLGLPTAQRLAGTIGGSVTCEALAVGTRFRIDLPDLIEHEPIL
jgi:signal transduction histidine kinase